MRKVELLTAIASFAICAYCFLHLKEVYMFKLAYILLSTFIGLVGVLFLIDSFEKKWQG